MSDTNTVNGTASPNTKAFLDWYETQKKERGLVDVKFFAVQNQKTTAESFFAQLMRMIRAGNVDDRKSF